MKCAVVRPRFPPCWLKSSIWLALLLSVASAAATISFEPPRLDAKDPIPLMAYYYIWFDEGSWERAKTDYPQLGRYSSDNEAVMRQHVRWAKEAGIDGFIVSWKSTSKLDSRLERLMEVAAAEQFALWVIYQGLDFERNPLPLNRIESDLDYFTTAYADHPAFGMYDKPVVIWSGTWEYSREDVGEVTNTYRDGLYILASERNEQGYLRLADIVDGNAYYWSSVNPDTYPGYQEKLSAMGEAVHRRGGIWVAPAAPGFDARLVGGTTVVERQDGAMLRQQMNAALRSSPNAVGLISWNEFSENSHVEPSANYGRSALEALAERRLSSGPAVGDFDSSAPATTDRGGLYGIYVLGIVVAFVGACLALLIVRVRRSGSLNLKPPDAGRSALPTPVRKEG